MDECQASESKKILFKELNTLNLHQKGVVGVENDLGALQAVNCLQ